MSINHPHYFAIVPAAGCGKRYGCEKPKQYAPLKGLPLIYHALSVLCQNSLLKGVWVVLAPDDLFWADYDWGGLGAKLEVLHCGGATRAETVRAGLYALRDRVKATDWILVHDAARPCLSAESLQRLLAALVDDPVGGLLALPVADTLKRANAAQRVICTESRENLWQAQTPQLFRYARLYEGLSRCIEATDEASAIEALGLTPQLIEGDSANLKVTYAHDLQVAEAILQMRERK